MNTGIIMIGLSLVLLSVGLISSPASAALPDSSCGSDIPLQVFPHGTPGSGTAGTTATTALPVTRAETKVFGNGMVTGS